VRNDTLKEKHSGPWTLWDTDLEMSFFRGKKKCPEQGRRGEITDADTASTKGGSCSKGGKIPKKPNDTDHSEGKREGGRHGKAL